MAGEDTVRTYAFTIIPNHLRDVESSSNWCQKRCTVNNFANANINEISFNGVFDTAGFCISYVLSYNGN